MSKLEFTYQLLSISLAQVMHQLGIDRITGVAHDFLIDLLSNYLIDIAKKSKIVSENDGRSKVHLLDVELDFLNLLNWIKTRKNLKSFPRLPPNSVEIVNAGDGSPFSIGENGDPEIQNQQVSHIRTRSQPTFDASGRPIDDNKFPKIKQEHDNQQDHQDQLVQDEDQIMISEDDEHSPFPPLPTFQDEQHLMHVQVNVPIVWEGDKVEVEKDDLYFVVQAANSSIPLLSMAASSSIVVTSNIANVATTSKTLNGTDLAPMSTGTHSVVPKVTSPTENSNPATLPVESVKVANLTAIDSAITSTNPVPAFKLEPSIGVVEEPGNGFRAVVENVAELATVTIPSDHSLPMEIDQPIVLLPDVTSIPLSINPLNGSTAPSSISLVDNPQDPFHISKIPISTPQIKAVSLALDPSDKGVIIVEEINPPKVVIPKLKVTLKPSLPRVKPNMDMLILDAMKACTMNPKSVPLLSHPDLLTLMTFRSSTGVAIPSTGSSGQETKSMMSDLLLLKLPGISTLYGGIQELEPGGKLASELYNMPRTRKKEKARDSGQGKAPVKTPLQKKERKEFMELAAAKKRALLAEADVRRDVKLLAKLEKAEQKGIRLDPSTLAKKKELQERVGGIILPKKETKRDRDRKEKEEAGTSRSRQSSLRNEYKAKEDDDGSQSDRSFGHGTPSHPPPAKFMPPKKVSKTDDSIRCICADYNLDYNDMMVECDVCRTWLHGACVGVQEGVVSFVCPRCV